MIFTWISGLWLVAASAMPPAFDTLRTQCLLYAADASNPWALAHGITAFGQTYAANDGRLAVDVIVHDFLQKGTREESSPYSFARYAADGTPIEPHTNLMVKTLTQARVPSSRKLKASFGPVTLAELVEGVQKGFVHVPQNEDYWREVGWTLDILAATFSPGPSAVFKNGQGQTIDVNQVMEDALSYLERTQSDLSAGLEQGLPQVAKRKQGIYAHPCGGLHLVQAVNAWARHASVRKKWKARLDKQTDILFYRLESESRQYDEALRKAPQYRLQILTQKIKFYGHFLETTGRLKKEAGFIPRASQKQAIAKAKALLDHAVRELEALSAFDSMEALKKHQRQIYLDLIGDACHAVNGWNAWP